jgi:hypothetical protein
MKTAYELAMERLSKEAPSVTMTPQKKKQLAELDSKYAAKIAEREIALKGEIDDAVGVGDMEKAGKLQERLVNERKALQAELEEKKNAVRAEKSR